MKRYLVTGDSGFVGERLIGFLKTTRCHVRVISRNKNSNYETFFCNLGIEKIPLASLDSVDTVIHLAANSHDTKSNSSSKQLYYDINVNATIELAQAAADSGVKSFVFISSTKAGGRPIPGKCSNEYDQMEPEGIYGKTKREAELRILEISKNSKMNVSIIRPALVYGPSMKGNLKLMQDMIKKGFFPPLPKNGNRRSLIHVDDLVRAIILLSEDDRSNGEVFIATDGEIYSSRDIYEAMLNNAGKTVPKWNVPKFIIDIAAKINPKIKYKLDKLFGDECYSSAKIEALGFRAKKTLKDMNKTSF